MTTYLIPDPRRWPFRDQHEGQWYWQVYEKKRWERVYAVGYAPTWDAALADANRAVARAKELDRA